MPGSIRQAEFDSPLAGSFTFSPLEHADFPLMLRWLNNQAVSEWWEAPPSSIDELEGKYVPRLDGSEQVYGFIAKYAETPMGFLQWYRLSTEPGHPAVGLVPENTAAIDLFIGEDEYRHRGLGAPMIQAFLRSVVFAELDVTACAIDPVPDNRAAISAYRKAGFRNVSVAFYEEEQEDVLIMLIDRADLIGDGVAEAAAEAAHADQDQK